MIFKKGFIFLTIALCLVCFTGAARGLSLLKKGAESYVFGFPLVLMDQTRASMTGDEEGKLLANHFSHTQYFPDDKFRLVVRPNNDTLYSIAWLDLAAEPVVLSVPAMGDRYYVMPFMDAWTNVFASVGTRETGQAAGDFVIAGPQFDGDVPDDTQLIRSPTNMVWLIGRIQTNTKADFAAVEKLQEQFKLTMLSEWGSGEPNRATFVREPPKRTSESPSAIVESMTAKRFFSELARLMGEYPPADDDKDAVKTLADIGVYPGKKFDYTSLDGAQKRVLKQSLKIARGRLRQEMDKDRGSENGWAVVREGIGVYGDQYRVRAFVSLIGLGALEPAEAVYPNARRDSEGELLSGQHRYRIRFAAGMEPPVDAFWSLTIYDTDGFLIENPINRFTLGDRDNLKVNEDGSIELLIQHQRPEGIDSNWLPAPEGDFAVTMRLYLPRKEFLDGDWTLPQIERIK